MTPPQRPIRAPELAELETFVVAATEGSLAAAATRLAISRPAVTKRIANLEALIGTAVFHRGVRGVRLTDTGAALLDGARRVLDERDALVTSIADIRGDGPSRIAGLLELLGHASAATRALQLPEARLTETERILELILRASATGVAISDAETRVFHEVNDAYCQILGRSRGELLGRSSSEVGIWHDERDYGRLRDELERTGEIERQVVRVQRPDGTVRVIETTVHLLTLGGRRRFVSTVDDITEQSLARADRDEREAGYHALARIAAFLMAGQPVVDCVGAALPELRRSGGFATAVVWDLERDRSIGSDGRAPPAELGRMLREGDPTITGVRAIQLEDRAEPASEGGTNGLVVALASTGLVLALLRDAPLSHTAQAWFETLLGDLVTLISARAQSAPSSPPSPTGLRPPG